MLGWLLQLDGDNPRDAFLSALWVKEVLPIQPRRETTALNWLCTIEGHENDGWDAPHLGTAEDAEFVWIKVLMPVRLAQHTLDVVPKESGWGAMGELDLTKVPVSTHH